MGRDGKRESGLLTPGAAGSSSELSSGGGFAVSFSAACETGTSSYMVEDRRGATA